MSNTTTIQIRRGFKASLPTSGAVGEPFFCLDTGETFIWDGSKMVPVGGRFVFTQSGASATWTINHNLNKHPNVVVEDSTGRRVEGDIQFVSNSQVVINFSAPFSGQATLS